MLAFSERKSDDEVGPSTHALPLLLVLLIQSITELN